MLVRYKYHIKLVMKKLIGILFAVMMLVGCSSGGTLYDTGVISTEVPNGWKGFHGADVFGDYEGEPGDPTVIQVGKGSEEMLDVFNEPYVMLQVHEDPNQTYKIYENMLDDPEAITEVKIGERTWSGFRGTSLGYDITQLLVREGDNALFVQITSKDGSITIDTPEVKTIIEKFTVK